MCYEALDRVQIMTRRSYRIKKELLASISLLIPTQDLLAPVIVTGGVFAAEDVLCLERFDSRRPQGKDGYESELWGKREDGSPPNQGSDEYTCANHGGSAVRRKEQAMGRRMSWSERQPSSLEAASEIYQELEACYDAHPETTYGETELEGGAITTSRMWADTCRRCGEAAPKVSKKRSSW